MYIYFRLEPNYDITAEWNNEIGREDEFPCLLPPNDKWLR